MKKMLNQVIWCVMILWLSYQIDGAPFTVQPFRHYDLSPFEPFNQSPLSQSLMNRAPKQLENSNPENLNATGKILLVDNISANLATLQSTITTLKTAFSGLDVTLARAIKAAPAG